MKKNNASQFINLYREMLKILDHCQKHQKQDLKIVDTNLIVVEHNFLDPNYFFKRK